MSDVLAVWDDGEYIHVAVVDGTQDPPVYTERARFKSLGGDSLHVVNYGRVVKVNGVEVLGDDGTKV